MSTQAELVELLDSARGVLHSIDGVAVSEVTRVEDGIQHAVSAAASMTVPEAAAPAPKPAAEPVEAVKEPAETVAPATVEPVEASEPQAPEAAADEKPQNV